MLVKEVGRARNSIITEEERVGLVLEAFSVFAMSGGG